MVGDFVFTMEQPLTLPRLSTKFTWTFIIYFLQCLFIAKTYENNSIIVKKHFQIRKKDYYQVYKTNMIT